MRKPDAVIAYNKLEAAIWELVAAGQDGIVIRDAFETHLLRATMEIQLGHKPKTQG